MQFPRPSSTTCRVPAGSHAPSEQLHPNRATVGCPLDRRQETVAEWSLSRKQYCLLIGTKQPLGRVIAFGLPFQSPRGVALDCRQSDQGTGLPCGQKCRPVLVRNQSPIRSVRLLVTTPHSLHLRRQLHTKRSSGHDSIPLVGRKASAHFELLSLLLLLPHDSLTAGDYLIHRQPGRC